MTNRTAYRVAAVMIPFIFALLIMFSFGPAEDAEFKGYWQIWHPFYIQLMGLLGIPIFYGYILPLANRLGGRTTAYGSFLWYQMNGTMAFILLGPVLNFIYLTCPSWTSRCDHPVGHVSAPSVLDIGFLAMYPMVAYGLMKLLTGLGTTWRRALQHFWYVPVVYTALAAVAVAPFALDLAFEDGQRVSQTLVELAYVVGSVLVVSLTTFTGLQTRKMGGGVLQRPIVLMCIGMFIISIGAFTRIHWTGHPTAYKVQDPATAPYSIGFVMWIIAVMMLGAALERMLGINRTADIDQAADAAA
jgi:hypothetical protein